MLYHRHAKHVITPQLTVIIFYQNFWKGFLVSGSRKRVIASTLKGDTQILFTQFLPGMPIFRRTRLQLISHFRVFYFYTDSTESIRIILVRNITVKRGTVIQIAPSVVSAEEGAYSTRIQVTSFTSSPVSSLKSSPHASFAREVSPIGKNKFHGICSLRSKLAHNGCLYAPMADKISFRKPS